MFGSRAVCLSDELSIYYTSEVHFIIVWVHPCMQQYTRCVCVCVWSEPHRKRFTYCGCLLEVCGPLSQGLLVSSGSLCVCYDHRWPEKILPAMLVDVSPDYLNLLFFSEAFFKIYFIFHGFLGLECLWVLAVGWKNEQHLKVFNISRTKRLVDE